MSGVSDKTAVLELSAAATKAPRMTMSRLPLEELDGGGTQPADAPLRMTMSRLEPTRSTSGGKP